MSKLYEQVLAGDYENHVLPFLWQKGESREVIADYLEKIAACDIHEVCLESRPHPDFMGEGWWSDLEFIIARCKELGLKIWLLDDAHFPTGYANGALKDLPEDDPLRKTVLTHRTLDAIGPTRRMSVAVTNMFDATERFYAAVAMRDGKPFDLGYDSVKDEAGRPVRLVFDAPEGLTQLVLVFTSKKSGFRDEYINMVDKESCDQLIKAVYEPHYERFGHEFGTTILGFFTDEPGFMNEKGAALESGDTDTVIGKGNGLLPWSNELERRLKAELGESFELQLPYLWNREPAGAHARHVYMDVATQLYRECFDENIGSWCREHGVMHIGHVIEDKGNHAHLGQGAGHFFRALGGQDMAGVDIVINQLVPGMDEGLHSYGRGAWDMEFFTYALAKLGSSAAHIDPLKQGRCMAEVFGAFGWHEGLKEMKWICDHFLVRGVNWYVPHAFSQAKFPDWDCPPHFYAHGMNPQFRQFGKLMSYLNRASTLLSGGVAVTEAAVLYHADAEWCGRAMPVQKIARELTCAQVGFDFVPEDAFADGSRYAVEVVDVDGAPRFTVNGQEYRCLVMPQVEFLGEKTVAFAARAAAAGVPVFAVGEPPRGTYDGAGADAAGFAPLDASALGGVRVTALSSIAQELVDAGLREIEVADYQPWLRAYRYDKQDERYLMLVNEHPKRAVDAVLPGVRGIALDLVHGEAPKAFDEKLVLAPYESATVVFGEDASGLAPFGEDAEPKARVDLSAGWSVAYAHPLAYPTFEEAQPIEELVDLSTSLYPGKAGTFRYERSFELDAAADLTLELEDAYEMVEVFVDGEPVGVRIAPPYRMSLGTLDSGEHALAIDVTNTLDHMVPDMFGMTEPSEPSGIVGKVRLELR